MKTAKRLLALLLALCMLFAIVACAKDEGGTDAPAGGGTDAPAQGGSNAPAGGGTDAPAGGNDAPAGGDEGEAVKSIVIGDVNAPNTFDVTGMQFSHWEKMVFDVLVDCTPEGELIPAIAETWEYTDDTTLVLNLRDDVFCTNGEQITASDCLWSLEFWATSTSQASGMTAFDFANSVADDENNVLTVKFTKPYGPGINAMCNYYMWDAEWAQNATGDDWWGAPNGSGAYTLVENVAGAYCSFQAKDDYWGEKPEVDFVTYKYYSEPATMFIDLENGDIDLAVGIQASDAERVMADPDAYPSLAWEKRELVDNMNLFLCDYVEYFQDKNVREAIFLALNGDEVATGMYGALFNHATSPMPAGILYHKETNIPEQNLERAQELMAGSAWPNGFELRLVVTTGQDLAATVIQEQLSKIGIIVNVETYDPGTAVPMMQKGEVDLSLRVGMGGAPYRDPFMGISDVFAWGSTMRATMMDDADFNAHYEAGLFSVDPATRQENYEWMQDWLVDEYHVYPIAERCTFVAWNAEKIVSADAVVASYINAKLIDLV